MPFGDDVDIYEQSRLIIASDPDEKKLACSGNQSGWNWTTWDQKSNIYKNMEMWSLLM